MSADAWRVCPRCQRRDDAAKAAIQRQVDEGYGVLPPDAWEGLRAKLAAWPALRETWREDHEFYGATTGTVHASYSGSCEVCGLALDFEDAHPIPKVGD